MGFRALAVVGFVLGGCGRLGFDREADVTDDVADDTDDMDVTDDTDVADDTDITDDSDISDITDDTLPIDGAPDSPDADCQTNTDYISLGAFPSRYRSVAVDMPWAEAALACTGDGAHLAVPDSLAEAIAIGGQGDWVGITDVATEGAWLTIFDAPPTYLQFQAGQPDGGDGEDCLRLENSGELQDRSCNDARDFVCECPL